MDIVTRSLKKHSRTPVFICDANGTLRCVRTILGGYIADLPEKTMIAGVPQNQSPISEASLTQFGDGLDHLPRDKALTCSKLQALVNSVDPSDLPKFSKAAKDAQLNGVHMLFWADWEYADPSCFLVPDALHDWHKFTMAHPIHWARMLLGDAEVDKRYSSLQRRVGFRHFKNGFTLE